MPDPTPAASGTPTPEVTPTPTPEPTPTPTPTPDPAPAAAATAPAPEPAPEPPKSDWRDARIAELTAKLHEERKKKVQVAEPQRPGETPAQFDERVEARARELNSQTEWARQCNSVIENGKAAYPDWQAKVDTIRKMVDPGDQGEVLKYNNFLAAAMETGQAHQILYDLAANPGEAKRLMDLSPVKQAAALATLMAGRKKEKEPSGAPAPITPVGGHGAHFEEINPDDPDRGMQLPKADWFARREKQVADRGLQ